MGDQLLNVIDHLQDLEHASGLSVDTKYVLEVDADRFPYAHSFIKSDP